MCQNHIASPYLRLSRLGIKTIRPKKQTNGTIKLYASWVRDWARNIKLTDSMLNTINTVLESKKDLFSLSKPIIHGIEITNKVCSYAHPNGESSKARGAIAEPASITDGFCFITSQIKSPTKKRLSKPATGMVQE